MKIKLYSVKDALSGFKAPFDAANDNIAIRNIKMSLDGVAKNVVYDYSVYYLGTLDDETGLFDSDVRWLANCVDLLPKPVKVEEIKIEEEEKKEIEE